MELKGRWDVRMTAKVRFKKDGKDTDWLGEQVSRKTTGPKQSLQQGKAESGRGEPNGSDLPY